MKRLAFLFCLLAACGRESHRESPWEPKPAAPPKPAPTTMVPAPATPPRLPRRSTPQQCAGDGSYGMAVDCFRAAAGFHFVFVVEKSKIEGDMSRSRPGLERVRFTNGGSEWTGITERSAVTWYRGNAKEASPPPIADQVYQRTTLFLDPQKKEGTPRLVGTKGIGGEECNHYHFTDANNGSAYDAFVSKGDGRLVELSIVTPPGMRKVMPPLSMIITRYGETPVIEVPK
jgi:hypothetical protein